MGERIRRAVALGLFDGVHLGHQAVIAQAIAQARRGLRPAVSTFSSDRPLPQAKQGGCIYPEQHKQRILRHMGVQDIFSHEFSQLRGLDGEQFVAEYLVGEMDAAYVCCGEDHRFGRGGACGVDELRALCDRYSIVLQVVPPVCDGQGAVSSTRIRQALCAGDLPAAAAMLGRPYGLYAVPQRQGDELFQQFPQQACVPHEGGYTAQLVFPSGDTSPVIAVVEIIAGTATLHTFLQGRSQVPPGAVEVQLLRAMY